MSKKYQLHLKGYVGGYDFDADYVDYVLGKNSETEVNVLIDSLGGSVPTALSISSAFRRHGNVNVHFVGMNASAATIASLGAKHISIDANAMYLVHKCSDLVAKYDLLNADELQTHIDECKKKLDDLQKIDLNIASMYAGKCKKSKESLLDLMTKGGWLSAEDALEWGFVDEITSAPEDVAPTLDKTTVSALAAAGIPIPAVDKSNRDNLFSRMFSAIIAKLTNNTDSPIINAMTKTFKFVCALLKVEALTSTDGQVTLTEEQLQTIEDRIATLEANVSDLTTQVDERDATITALKSKPAEVSTTIVDDSGKRDDFATGYVNSLNHAREMFNSIP